MITPLPLPAMVRSADLEKKLIILEANYGTVGAGPVFITASDDVYPHAPRLADMLERFVRELLASEEDLCGWRGDSLDPASHSEGCIVRDSILVLRDAGRFLK